MSDSKFLTAAAAMILFTVIVIVGSTPDFIKVTMLDEWSIVLGLALSFCIGITLLWYLAHINDQYLSKGEAPQSKSSFVAEWEGVACYTGTSPVNQPRDTIYLAMLNPCVPRTVTS